MVRSVLMFVVALVGVAAFAAPNTRWAPVAATAAPATVVADAAAVEAAAGEELTPSFLVPVKRVAFPPQPIRPVDVAVVTTTTPEVIDEDLDTRTVTAEALNVREAPSSQSFVVGKLLSGASVTVIGQERSWLHVETADGLSGWVSSKFVTQAPS
jgi:uncharacterized protein YgiM (DUF1202 family)